MCVYICICICIYITADAVVVELAARAARAGVAHLPEVVLHVSLDHAVGREVLQRERDMMCQELAHT